MSSAQETRRKLDVVTIGRCSVDLYGQQIGSRLEDIASFAKSVGGCPANIAIGTARLGLRSAIITRVGDEQMGRFVKEQMAREGVALDGIVTDPARLTALVLLSVENDRTFPLIFYRDNCADSALDESDVDEALVASSASVLVTARISPSRTATPRSARPCASQDSMAERSSLTSTTGQICGGWPAWGPARNATSGPTGCRPISRPSCRLRLIVGTEEEVHIAAGSEDTLEALKIIRALSKAVIVLKRGPMGCVVYPGAIPNALDKGIVGQGFPIEVYNVLGAGDSFMSGFLRGWLRGEDHATSATWANACGAFAVSRLLCSPEIPTWAELQYFLTQGSTYRALRKDQAINHIHWATTRRPQPDTLMALAIDHRKQLTDMTARIGAPPARINEFKRLAIQAIAKVSDGRPGFGTLLDDIYGREAMFDAARLGLWVGRPLEEPGSRPLRFEFTQDVGARLVEWPVTIRSNACPSITPTTTPNSAPNSRGRSARSMRPPVRWGAS